MTEVARAVLGETCYHTLVEELDLGNAECLQLLVSKLLSLAIIAAGALVKVPQVQVIVQKQRARGVSLSAVMMELLCYMVSLAYNYRNDYPFTTYGETFFIALQDAVIVVLILWFGTGSDNSRNPVAALSFPALFLAIGYVLLNPNAISPATLVTLQSLVTPVLTLSRVQQLYTNYMNRSTGDLSAVSVFMFALGSLVRVFTTLREVNDNLILYGFILGFVVNMMLAGQVVYYWGREPTKAKDLRSSPRSSPRIRPQPPPTTDLEEKKLR